MAAPPAYDVNTEKLVTDYLTALRKHAEQILRYKLPSSALESLPIEYVVSQACFYVRPSENWLSSSRSQFPLCGLTQHKLRPDSAQSRQAWASAMRCT